VSAWHRVGCGSLLMLGLGAGAMPATALQPALSDAHIAEAVEAGTAGMTQDDFGEEWLLRPPGGEIAVSTPFSRLAHAARQAALKGTPLTDKQRQEQVDRGKDRIQLVVTLQGRAVDFARWFQPVLLNGNAEVKASFVQNERTALRLEDGRYAARNIYVFPLEGLPPAGAVTLVVRNQPDGKEVWRARIELDKFR
jgi:hypothetical protein